MRLAFRSTRPWDLVVAGMLLVAGVACAVLAAPGWLRVPVGLLFVLAVPGYAFVAALFPESYAEASEDEARRGLSALERTALGLGLSIAIVPLLGLALNFTPWGIRLVPVLLTVGVFSAVCLLVAWRRRAALPPARRFALAWEMESEPWAMRSGLDKALTVGLVLAVLFAAGSLAYVLATPRQAEAFTEFYVLGPTGKAACYPASYQKGGYQVAAADVEAGCPLDVRNVTLGVVNHEGAPTTYWLRTLWTQEERRPDNTTQVLQVRQVSLASFTLAAVPVDTSLERAFQPQHEESLVLPPPPFNGTVRLSFLLTKDTAGPTPTTADPGFTSAYRRLHLWITVA